MIAGDLREIDSDDSTEAFFRTFLEAAPDAMVIIDAQGKIAIVNTQAEKIFGYKHKKLIGKPIEKLLPKAASRYARGLPRCLHQRSGCAADGQRPEPHCRAQGRQRISRLRSA